MARLILGHSINGKIICFNIDPSKEAKRLYRLKKKAMFNHLETQMADKVWVTFTLDNKGYAKLQEQGLSKYWSKFLTKVRNYINRDYQKRIRAFMPYFWSGKKDSYRTSVRWSYFWKIEMDSSGKREINPHFHVICSNPLFKYKTHFKEFLLQAWQNGFIRIKYIRQDTQKLKNYLSKYFTKGSAEFNERCEAEFKIGKWWGTSRDYKVVPRSDYKRVAIEQWEHQMSFHELDQLIWSTSRISTDSGIKFMINLEFLHKLNPKHPLFKQEEEFDPIAWFFSGAPK